MKNRINKIPAVIVGIEINGLGVARALSKENIPCIGVSAPGWNPCCETNACEVVYARSWSCEGLINDLKLLGQRWAGKAPLIITKDEPVLWISEFRRELEEFYEIYLPEHHVVELLMNKRKFYDAGIREGWPFPMTRHVNNKDELMCTLREIIYPCILKPQLKNSEFRKHAPEKAYKIRNESELKSIYNLIAQWEPEVIIQEWIEGGDDRIAYCLTYFNRQGEPVIHFPGRKLRQWPVRCGNTALAEPAPKEWVEAIIMLTDTIFRSVGFRGLGSIEFKMRPGTNTPVIMEPTVGRTNYQSEIAVINGVNIPAIAYCDLTKQKHVLPVFTSTPVKLIDGKHEAKSALKYWRAGELGLLRWIQERSGKKKYMLFRANDLRPFIASMGVAALTIFKAVARPLIKTLAPNLLKARAIRASKRNS
jgi:D-aspartate ligase